MSTHQAASQIRLTPMEQLAEAVDREDDWTGITDAASRRKRQNRLNVRAYRRRKALESQARTTSTPPSPPNSNATITSQEPPIPCWIEDLQTVSFLPSSVASKLHITSTPLLLSAPFPDSALTNSDSNSNSSSNTKRPPAKLQIIFPLSQDHLITLLAYNVLRSSIINRALVNALNLTLIPEPNSRSDCSSAPLRTLPVPSALTLQEVPPSLHPTALQLSVPHEAWIDIIPHPVWRDNALLLSVTNSIDEDQLWSDTIGGLFEGFPDEEVERRGLIVWGPPWDIRGWEMSEGFWRRWGWTIEGCEGILESTNAWRRKRGEKELV